MRFKNTADLKFYLYISTAKLEMLWQQIVSSSKEKKSFEWGIDIKALKFIRKTEGENEPDQGDKLSTVVQTIEELGLVGTIDEPREYVRGTLPMRWGIYRDAGRPEAEPPLAYFGGRTVETVFGFGGSTRHVIGVVGSSATGSRSATPYLLGHLLSGLEIQSEGWRAYGPGGDTEYQAFVAIAFATDHLKGPVQNLEFYAKTLLTGKFVDRQDGREEWRRVLLGTPIYVALAAPYPPDFDDY